MLGQRDREELSGPTRWQGGRERDGQRTRLRETLLFANKLEFKERALQSEHQHCPAGERGPRCAPGFTRRGSLLQRGRKEWSGPNLWQGGRERDGQRTRLTEAPLFVFLLTGARCSNQAENNYIEGYGDSSVFQFFVFDSFFFCCVVLCFFFRTYQVRTYMKAASGLSSWMGHRAWSSWHLQVTCLHQTFGSIYTVLFLLVS